MPSARGGATTTSDLTLPAASAVSMCCASLVRKTCSAWSCQSVCATALRAPPTEFMTRPGASVPCSWVASSFCSNTSTVLRLGNLASPSFLSTSALAPSHTTTHSPLRIDIPDMNDLLKTHDRLDPAAAQSVALDQTLRSAIGCRQRLP